MSVVRRGSLGLEDTVCQHSSDVGAIGDPFTRGNFGGVCFVFGLLKGCEKVARCNANNLATLLSEAEGVEEECFELTPSINRLRGEDEVLEFAENFVDIISSSVAWNNAAIKGL